MLRELLTKLSVDDLISILFAVASRLSWRGILTITDAVVIKELTDDPPGGWDRAA